MSATLLDAALIQADASLALAARIQTRLQESLWRSN